ncbi:MAG: ComF family protein [Desulfobulbaceae bacterium]|nr:ComF family protein [Desulfobulbaceae bacterium]HIJ89385.1 ComF family protein [Deltaproteobacteria bacterium]
MKLFFKALLDLLLPSFCLSCEKPLGPSPELLFCPDCLERLHHIQSPLCPCCGRTYLVAAGGDHHCGICLATPRHFNRARALFLYEEPIKKVIHRFKYRGMTTCLPSFARVAHNLPQLAEMAGADWIVPVPLHPSRLQERGFNQALLLARALFPKDRRISSSLLVRSHPTEPQTSFNGKARRTNLKNVFAVVKPQKVAGKKILLIDDVFTTGTTVNECARVLKKCGATEVMVLTLARVKEDY